MAEDGNHQEGSLLDQVAKLSQAVEEQREFIAQFINQNPETSTTLNENFRATDNPDLNDQLGLGNSDGASINFNSSEADIFDINFDSAVNEPEDDLMDVFQDIEADIEYGPELKPNVAEGIEKTVKRPLSKETAQSVSSRLKVPVNCKALAVPKMNPEIWSQLPTNAKVQDLNLQQLQQAVSYGLIALANIANMIAANTDKIKKDMAQDILRTCMDGANLVGNGSQALVQKRRMEVKPYLNSDFAGICATTTPVTSFLFGDDLKETLKSSRTSSQVVKKGFTRAKYPRFQPYANRQPRAFAGTGTSTSSGFNLNRPYPSPMPQRRGGGWNNRSRGPNWRGHRHQF